MLDRDVEKLLAELRPEALPPEADAQIVAAIRNAQGAMIADVSVKPVALYRKPIPAWAAVAACVALSAASWSIGARSVPASPLPRNAERVEAMIEKPAVTRVHVESNVFVASPSRELDVSKWSPVSGTNSESRS